MNPTRSGHPFWMYDELIATPAALDKVLAPEYAERAQRDSIVNRLRTARQIYLTGCGTAYHAALVGASLLGALSGGHIHARAVEAFELAHYEQPAPGPDDALLALSHSGQPAATLAALRRAHERGVFCVAITGNPESPTARAADAVLNEGYSDVKSFAYTISYSLMLALLADLAERVGTPQEAAISPAVAHLPAMHRAALELDEPIRRLAEQYPTRERWIFAGAGGNYATALEAGLKMQETNYTASAGMQMEEVLHGPVATLGDAVLVVIAPPGAGRDRSLDLLRAARVLSAPTIAVGQQGDNDLASAADAFLGMPTCSEALSPAPYHVPIHLLSYWLAVARGHNPDLMRRENTRYLEARKSYAL